MEVKYIEHMGSDLTVVNAARVSFGSMSTATGHRLSNGTPVLNGKDERLIRFLARGCNSGDWQTLLENLETAFDPDNMDMTMDDAEEMINYIRRMPTHWTPFGHAQITLHFKTPFFVANQLKRTQVGFVLNEISRRYVDEPPEFYMPDFRARAESVKQGSVDHVDPILDAKASGIVADLYSHAENAYQDLLDMGVAPEQARVVFPQGVMTEWWWTGSLYGFVNLYIQRSDLHAQKESRLVADMIKNIIEPLYPVSWEALTGNP